MKKDIPEIRDTLQRLLKQQVPPLRIRTDSEENFEVAGTKETMQGKQKVDGFYFASVVPKPKDVRFYFFPIYTHPDQFQLSDDLKKLLKGKSCFHVKHLTPELEKELRLHIEKGVDLYQGDHLI